MHVVSSARGIITFNASSYAFFAISTIKVGCIQVQEVRVSCVISPSPFVFVSVHDILESSGNSRNASGCWSSFQGLVQPCKTRKVSSSSATSDTSNFILSASMAWHYLVDPKLALDGIYPS